MSSKSIFGKNLDNTLTSDDILGKDVIDVHGRIIGISEKIFFDEKSLNFIGIAVDKGILKNGMGIGKDYIERITPYAIFLNVPMLLEMKGVSVFDKNAKKIGVVKRVLLKKSKNVLSAIDVKRDGFGKNIIIPENYIETLGDNIILNVSEEEIKELLDSVRSKEVKV